MALSSSLSVLFANSIPKFYSSYFNPKSVSVPAPLKLQEIVRKRGSSTRLNGAGFAEIEPDLNEDPRDRWETNSISPVCFNLHFFLYTIHSVRESWNYLVIGLICIVDLSQEDFKYGEYDGHHTYFEGEKKGMSSCVNIICG